MCGQGLDHAVLSLAGQRPSPALEDSPQERRERHRAGCVPMCTGGVCVHVCVPVTWAWCCTGGTEFLALGSPGEHRSMGSGALEVGNRKGASWHSI